MLSLTADIHLPRVCGKNEISKKYARAKRFIFKSPGSRKKGGVYLLKHHLLAKSNIFHSLLRLEAGITPPHPQPKERC